MDEEESEGEMMDLDAEESYDSESPDEIPAKVTRLPEPVKKENIPAKVTKQVVPDSDSEDDSEDEDDKLVADMSDNSSDEEDDSEEENDLAKIMAAKKKPEPVKQV